MSNIFEKIGVGLTDVGNWVADAAKFVVGIASKVKTILSAEKALEPAFINGLSTVVADVESLISLSEGIVAGGDLHLVAGTPAYNEFLKLISDFKALTPIVEEGIAALKQ